MPYIYIITHIIYNHISFLSLQEKKLSVEFHAANRLWCSASFKTPSFLALQNRHISPHRLGWSLHITTSINTDDIIQWPNGHPLSFYYGISWPLFPIFHRELQSSHLGCSLEIQTSTSRNFQCARQDEVSSAWLGRSPSQTTWGVPWDSRFFVDTLWLCQNSYWKWPFVVSFPIKNGDFFHTLNYQRVNMMATFSNSADKPRKSPTHEPTGVAWARLFCCSIKIIQNVVLTPEGNGYYPIPCSFLRVGNSERR